MNIIDFLEAVKRIPLWDREPVITDEDLEDLINQVDMGKKSGDTIRTLFSAVGHSSIFLVDFLCLMKGKHGKIMDSLFAN